MRPTTYPYGSSLDVRAALPLLIDGPASAGASLFSVCSVAALVEAGERVVACTAYPSARDELLRQLGWEDGDRRLVDIVSVEDLTRVGDEPIIWIASGRGDLLAAALRTQPDIAARVVFLKNTDVMLSRDLAELLMPHDRRILMGDLSMTEGGDAVRVWNWGTRVTFGRLSDPRYVGWATGSWSGHVALQA